MAYEFHFTSGTEKQIAYASKTAEMRSRNDTFSGSFQGLCSFLDGSMVKDFFGDDMESPIRKEAEKLMRVMQEALKDAGAFLDLAEHTFDWEREGLGWIGDGETLDDVIARVRANREKYPRYMPRLRDATMKAYEDLKASGELA